jgi:hypothetical protein
MPCVSPHLDEVKRHMRFARISYGMQHTDFGKHHVTHLYLRVDAVEEKLSSPFATIIISSSG